MLKPRITELEQWGPIDGKVLYPSFWFWATVKGVYKKTGIAWPTYYGIFDHDRMTYFWSKQEMQKKGELALKKVILRNKKCKELWDKYIFVCNQALSLKNLNIPIENKFKLSMDYLFDFWAYALVAEAANFASPDYLRLKLKKYVSEEQIDQVLEIMMAPEKLSFLQTGEQTLYKTALKAKNKFDLLIRLKKYAEEWFWLENGYYENKILDAKDFYKQIKNFSKKDIALKLKIINQYKSDVVGKKLKVSRQFHLPAELFRLIKQMAFSIWWQDHRKAMVLRVHCIVDELVKVTVQRYNLTNDDLYYYSAEEWQKLWHLGKKVNSKEIEQRKNFFALIVGHGYYEFFYGNKAKAIKKLLAEQNKIKNSSLVKGIVVSRGDKKIIKGRVRIITSPRFADKMRTGDILVAPMTSPDFIAVMRKASVIVTDVGGLTSHAAVVSRELHIPCIVNTKFATKVFKDGDLVEVDADKGIVYLRQKATADK